HPRPHGRPRGAPLQPHAAHPGPASSRAEPGPQARGRRRTRPAGHRGALRRGQEQPAAHAVGPLGRRELRQ
ncbi:unnamed protein product, partial [Prorocentrum cordatum]